MPNNFSRDILFKKSKAELLDLAMEHNVPGYKKLNKSELIEVLSALGQKQRKPQENKKQAGLWSKYSNHIYGLASLVGLVIAIYALNLGSDKSNTSSTSTKELIDNPEILPAEIRDKNVAVMIFEDETKDESLSAVGKMISDWVSNGLMNINKGKVISAANVRKNEAFAVAGGGAQPSFAERTGAEILIQGRYYVVENQIFLHADIVNAGDGSTIKSLQPISGDKTKIMDLIDALSQNLLGYWATADDMRYDKHPPKYKAYQSYVEAMDTYVSNDAITEKKLLKAIELDSTFYVAMLKLAVVYENNYRTSDIDPILDKLKDKQSAFNEYEQLRFKSIKAKRQGKLHENLEIREQMAKIDPSSLFSAGLSAIWAQQHLKAISYFQQHAAKFKDDNITWWEQYEPAPRYVEALLRLDRTEEAANYIDSLDFQITNDYLAANHLLTLVRLEDWESFEKFDKAYQTIPTVYYPPKLLACIYLYKHNQVQLQRYLPQLLIEINKMPSDNLFKNSDLAIYHFLAGNYLEVPKHLESYPWLYGRSAVALVKAGQLKEAKELMERSALLDTSNFPAGEVAYNEAVYHSALGNKEKAMDAIRTAFNTGKLFDVIAYDSDPFLKDLQDYPPFIEFVKPKG